VCANKVWLDEKKIAFFLFDFVSVLDGAAPSQPQQLVG
jgi:hypothetical protein